MEMGNAVTNDREELAKQHGSLRAAARVLQIDHAYLWRLQQGEKNDPSEDVLRKLELRRIVRVTYVRRVDVGSDWRK